MILFNFNLDDVHPEKGFGYFDEKMDFLGSLCKMFKGIKISLFVTPNWIDLSNDPMPIRYIKYVLRRNFSHSYVGEPFRIDKPEFKNWIDFLNRYVRKGNFEILVHGYTHHQDGVLHSAEFMNLDYRKCKEKIEKAEAIFEKSGLLFTRGFRPPGWRFSRSLLTVLKERGYRFVSTRPSTSRTFKVIEVLPGLYDIPQNWSVSDSIKLGLEIAKKQNCVLAKAHISEWCDRDYIKDGLTKSNFNKLVEFISRLEDEFEVKYVSLEEVVALAAGEIS